MMGELCKACNHLVSDETNFCPNCGVAQKDVEPSKSAASSSTPQDQSTMLSELQAAAKLRSLISDFERDYPPFFTLIE